MILIVVNIFPKLHARQLRLWVFFGAVWHWHLGILRKLHTKHWFSLNFSMQLLFGIPIMKLRLLQKTAARWSCRRWRNTSSVCEMLDELEWPSLESRRERSFLTFFYKIHSGTVSLDKDKYLTLAPNLRRIGHHMNHNTQDHLPIVMP